MNFFFESLQSHHSARVPTTTAKVQMSYSKPIRKPRFRDWLLYILDNNLCDQDARWKDKSTRTAIIRWPHKSRGTWSLEKDAKLFEMWAVVSGKYRTTFDTPNPKSWKCNFRMNLNICKNIVELKQQRIAKGPNACRVFRFVEPSRKSLQHCSFSANWQVAPGRRQTACYQGQSSDSYSADGYLQGIFEESPEAISRTGNINHGIKDMFCSMPQVNSVGRYQSPEMDEIPEQVVADIWSLSNQALSAETGHTSFQQVQQNHPFNDQHQPNGSRSSLTAFETIEQDPIKMQIDAFEAAQLNKLADSYGEPPEYCESHM